MIPTSFSKSFLHDGKLFLKIMNYQRGWLLLGAAILSLSPVCMTASAKEPDISVFEKLASTKIFSVSKFDEALKDTPAAAYVITTEAIRNSGAVNVMEALRLVPGLQVAQMSGHRYAISARGFNNNLANKLLVLIDGRSVYTPQFSGVFWDSQDMSLEEIERIEVIRGPGASLWGANAVNGVINIITKSAKDTEGTTISGLMGNQYYIGDLQHSRKLNDHTYARVSHRSYQQNSLRDLAGNDLKNDWHYNKDSFRIDWDNYSDSQMLFTGSLMSSGINYDLIRQDYRAPYTRAIQSNGDIGGGHLLGRWNQKVADDRQFQLQMYYDRWRRSFSTLSTDITTYDLDFQHIWEPSQGNVWTCGSGHRQIMDTMEGSETFFYDPIKNSEALTHIFVQNKYPLKNNLTLTSGLKAERNEHTGIEYLPNVRLNWSVTPQNNLWAAVSRAVRTPSRSDDDAVLAVNTVKDRGFVRFFGDDNTVSEKIIAYEAGYKSEITPSWAVDTSLFYNFYDDLITTDRGANPGVAGTAVSFIRGNKASAKSHGIEISNDLQLSERHHMILNYSLLKLDVNLDPTSTDPSLAKDEGSSPQQQVGIQSSYRLADNIWWNNNAYYVDRLPTIGVNDYLRYDTHLSWQPTEGLELILAGQNLLNAWHSEFSSSLNEPRAQVGRSGYVQAVLRF